MGLMSTSKRLADKAKSLSKALSGRFSNDTSSDVASSSRAAPGSFDFQPELYDGAQPLATSDSTAAAPGKRPSRGSGSLVR